MGEKIIRKEAKKPKVVKKPVVETPKTIKVADQVVEVTSRVRFCGCTASSTGSTVGAQYQDSIYGRGHRVHTFGGKSATGVLKSRCTVCGK